MNFRWKNLIILFCFYVLIDYGDCIRGFSRSSGSRYSSRGRVSSSRPSSSSSWFSSKPSTSSTNHGTSSSSHIGWKPSPSTNTHSSPSTKITSPSHTTSNTHPYGWSTGNSGTHTSNIASSQPKNTNFGSSHTGYGSNSHGSANHGSTNTQNIGWTPQKMNSPTGGSHTTSTQLKPPNSGYSNTGIAQPNAGSSTHNIGWNTNLGAKAPLNHGSQHQPHQVQHQTHVGSSNTFKSSAPNAPSAPPSATNYGWKITPQKSGSGNVASGHQQNSGYGHSNVASSGWKAPVATGAGVTAQKNWQTSSGNANYANTQHNGLNYPRQQYSQPNQHTSYVNNQYHPPSHQPTVVNNIITNNHHTNYHTPTYASSYPRYHFVSYNHYPTYYSPFHDYYPISLGLQLALHSHLGHDHGYHDHHHYHHNTYTSTSTTTTNNNGVTSTNTVSVSSNNPNGIPNQNNNNQNNNNNPNMGSGGGGGNNYQNIQQNNQNNSTLNKPNSAEPAVPLVYTIPGQTKNGDDDVDSTEIIFTNPYLIVGVENLLFYGEFHDEEDVIIVIEQGSDGLEPKFLENWLSQQPIDMNLNATVAILPENTTINDNQPTETTSTTTPSPTESIKTSTEQILSNTTPIPLAQFPDNSKR